jgi:hypothetical protein
MNDNSELYLKYLNENEYHLWDEFVDNIEYGTIFNKSLYLKKIAEILDVKFSVLVALDINKKICGGFAFCHFIKLKFIKSIYFPPIVQYYSILIQDIETKNKHYKQVKNFDLINQIIKFLENDFSILYFEFPPQYKDVRPLIWKNYKCELRFTYTENLQKINEIEGNFGRSLKNKIRSGKKLSYKIVKENTLENIKNLYFLKTNALEKINFQFLFTENAFVNLITELYNHKSAKIYTLHYEGKPISSILTFFHKTNVFLILYASDEKYFKTGLSSVLLVDLFHDLSTQGYTNLDFLGANLETIARYKANYNFELQTYAKLNKEIGVSKIIMNFRRMIKNK